jgi:hypothetical protein
MACECQRIFVGASPLPLSHSHIAPRTYKNLTLSSPILIIISCTQAQQPTTLLQPTT